MKIEMISATELDNYVKKDNVIIVDVRSAGEFGKSHICDAQNIPLDKIEKQVFEKEKTIIVYCERGAASLVAASQLQKKGYHVKSVVGGINSYHGRFLCR